MTSKYLGLLLILAVSGLALARFIATEGNLHSGDLNFPISADAHLREHYPIWNPLGLGNEPLAARLLLHLPFILSSNILQLDGGAYAKLLTVSAIAGSATAGYGATRILARLLTPQLVLKHPWCTTGGAVTCGLLYAFNPWSLSQLEHLHILAGLAPAPIVFALFVRGLILNHFRSTAVAATLAALISTATPHSILLTLLLVVFATIFQVTVGFSPEDFTKRLRGAGRSCAQFTALFFLASAFAWLPLLIAILGDGQTVPIYMIVDQDLRLLSSNQSWLNTVRLVGNWYWSRFLQPLEGAFPEWGVISLIPLASLFVATALGRNLWRLMAFLLALGTGAAVLVAATASPPFDAVLRDAVVNIPLGWLVREPDRGSWFLAFAYSVGAGLAVMQFLVVVEVKWRQLGGLYRFSTIIAFAFVASILFGYTAPAIRGLLWEPHTAVLAIKEPAEYLATEAKLNALSTRTAGRILVIGVNKERFWSRGRRVDSFLARSLKQRSVSNITELGRTFGSLIGETVLKGGNPRKLLLDAGITLVAVEADYPLGRSIRSRFRNELAYPSVIDGQFLSLFQVPDATNSALPTSSIHPIAVAGGLRIVAGIATLEPDAEDVPGVSSDYVQISPSTVIKLEELRVGLGGAGTRELSVASSSGTQLMSVMDATINADPAHGWARASTTDLTYSRWRDTLTTLGIRNWQLDHSLGIVFTTANDSLQKRFSQHFPPGTYKAWVRTFSSPAGGRLRVAIADTQETSSGSTTKRKDPILVTDLETSASLSAFEWRELGNIDISGTGYVEVMIAGLRGLNAVSAVALSPSTHTPPMSTARRTDKHPLPDVSWQRLSSTKYVANVTSANAPFLLILHEHFNPRWIAHTNGQHIQPVLTSGISNGYVLPAIDEGTITIEYSGQILYDLGIAISGATALLVLLALSKEPALQLARRSPATIRRSMGQAHVWVLRPPSVHRSDLYSLRIIAESAARSGLSNAESAARSGLSNMVALTVKLANAFWIQAPSSRGISTATQIITAAGRLSITTASLLLPTAALFAVSGSANLANDLVTIALAMIIGAIGLLVIGKQTGVSAPPSKRPPEN